ncbi:protein kinase [Pseudenhygromyxa sp. WMMC2535]|uniref:serine/threonine-protein kinase n=1 Tax=Pseudenhygromyxa sp. WMMC2535 TaxID=2712867 RepID=UPI0015573DDA|nr:serine/threonine-protein kinase [Pseudenhygromyxa sp. WMMC2535]NVB40726.1 protein kinase [Pseudenhygromyxa sp. WMMC2535]
MVSGGRDSNDGQSSGLRPGERFAGRYQIEALVGRGGMGSVYRAHDLEVGERVALKTLDIADNPDALERFRREVRLARRVTHRNAARTYDLGEHRGLRYLTMEFVEGASLRQWLRQRPSLGARLEIAEQLCQGLAAAHAAEVVHRDLKPSNILVEARGRAVITDFGIARTNTERTIGQTGNLLGTPAYMAPEQVEGRQSTARSDLYAFGLILYEMLTGALPFTADNPFALAMARLTRDVDLEHPAILAPLAPVLAVCLARDPDARASSADEVARALASARQALAELGALASVLERGDEGDSELGEGEPDEGDSEFGDTQATRAALGSTSLSVHQSGPQTELATAFGTPAPATTTAQRAPKALAVLPFRYRGPSEHDYFADAMLEELTDLLSMTRGLEVRGSGTTGRYADPAGARDPQTIGEEIGVDVIVDGTIQVGGPRLRIAARLLDVSSGFQLWSERFDGQLTDVFELQDRMCKRIAEALRVELEVISHQGLRDPEALEHYMRARQAKLRWRMHGPDGAVASYRAVLERVPDFAPAIAGLAFSLIRAGFLPSHEPIDWERETAEAIERALKEAPHLAETQVAAASWSIQNADFRDAALKLREALRIAPTCAIAHEYLGRLQIEGPKPERGRAHLELAYELDPALDWCLGDLARYRALRGDLDGYDALMARLFTTTERQLAPGMLHEMRVGAWYRDRGRIERALDALDPNSDDRMTQMIRGYAPPLLRPYDPQALAAEHELLQQASANSRLRSYLAQLAAEQTAFHRDAEATLGHLRRAADMVLSDIDWLDHCPLLDPLRDDPRFRAIRATVYGRCKLIWAS